MLALIPARAGSKGIPNKNFRDLVGQSPAKRAVLCAVKAGIERIRISTNDPQLLENRG